ncbi:hypothetical protein NPX13_g1092 [Xylaria arbuscula]|uniref:Efflux pump antibiotic resistance protein n=1 Tax=Xylaria arbuscula TaxID=114810 RepID=A0A9W8NMA1_9PEZI|nr:hypothetical protein NPX13_g1092 [Xylaria arbuscula]
MGESKVQSGDGLKVIHASLYRMATKSMAQAYTILGYKVNHALLGHSLETNWNGIEKAAEATFPTMAMRRFDRRDWDELWGNEYDIVTDIACPFNLELIKAYPDAKVVIVQRDFDGWWKSFEKNIKDKVFEFPKSHIIALISTLFLGVRPIQSQRKALFGMFDVRSPAGINKARGREVYDEYFKKIREIVPPENRLEYKIGDGWEPLCKFLGVPVPEGVEFPRSNDGAALNDQTNSRLRMHASRMATNSFIGKMLVVFLLLCAWMAFRLLFR